MKLNKWLYGITALAMLAACSDRDAGPGGDDEKDLGSPESGYLAVEIKLPQQGSTRGTNDVFDDGTSNEYAVDNAMIVIFKGADEKEARFYKAQDLIKPFLTNVPTNDNITSSYIAAVQVSSMPQNSNETYWGLVILNRNKETTKITEPDEDGNETVMIAGEMFSTSSTFHDILNAKTTNSFLKQTGNSYSSFFMTNAPLSPVPGGGSDGTGLENVKIKYLSDLGNTTYKTIDEAKQHVKNCIYVERAVAKVTCSMANSSFQLNIVDANGNKIADKDMPTITPKVRYALTNTNQISYTVRNVEFTENIEQSTKPQHFSWALKSDKVPYYRMVGEASMPKLNSPYHNYEPSLYRTYWCKDPNYKESMKADEKHVVSDVKELVDIDQPLYCKENTFTVANQNYSNTTLALFEVTFTLTKDGKPYGDGNLYIKGGDNSKIYASETDAASDEITRIKNNQKILDALTEAMKASGKTNIDNATQYLNIGFGFSKDDPDQIYLLLTSISLVAHENGFNAAGVAKFKEIIGEANDPNSIQYEVLGAVNALNEIQRFKDCKSYYIAPIKHFGDEYCPWTETTGVTTEAVYNGNKKFDTDEAHARNYLGRYGMVRNNWYALTVNSVTTLGSPKIPDITLSLSDDNKEEKSYIGVEIHILSWAKRTQSVDF